MLGQKNSWGPLIGRWVPHDAPDNVVDFVRWPTVGCNLSLKEVLTTIGLYENKFRQWEERYGKINNNGKIPRDFWIQPWEREAVIEFHSLNPVDGYRQLTYMTNDAGVVAVSPLTVYRVLKSVGLTGKREISPSKKGTGFHQPSRLYHHWHIDVAYINLDGTFCCLCMVLDGYSRYLVSWDLREHMTEKEIELIVERGREKFPGVNPRIISYNGPQFISKDFKEYVRICAMTHARASPFYPQSNGKMEALNKTAKKEGIRPSDPRSVVEAKITHVSGYRRINL